MQIKRDACLNKKISPIIFVEIEQPKRREDKDVF